jgi:hypothetical protein
MLVEKTVFTKKKFFGMMRGWINIPTLWNPLYFVRPVKFISYYAVILYSISKLLPEHHHLNHLKAN